MKRLLGRKKVMLLVPVVVIVLAAVGVLFVLPMLSPDHSLVIAVGPGQRGAPESAQAAEPTPSPKEATPEPGIMYALNERIVNLADTGSFHYLKSQIVLEFDLPDAKNLKADAYKKRQEEFAKEMQSWRPRIDDLVTTVLGSKTSQFLSTAGGKEQLREDLTARLADAVGGHKLVNLYFTQFIIQ